MCAESGCWTIGHVSFQLVNTLRVTIDELKNKISELGTTIVATILRDVLSDLQNQFAVLEKSYSIITQLEDDHVREMTVVNERINTTIQSQSFLKIDDQDDMILMLLAPMKLLISEHQAAGEAWAATHVKEEAHTKDMVDRARALLANTKESVELEGTVRVAVEAEFQQRHREHMAQIADNLLQDGIRVWVSKSNIFATLMTECLVRIDGHQLTIEPIKTCFDEECLRELHDNYVLDHTCLDMQETKFTIDLRHVKDLTFTNRRATIPGTYDETSPYWEPPRHHRCVHIRTGASKEYFLADRRNEPQNRTWVGLQQSAPDGSPSLLCQKLVQCWQEAKESLS